MQRPGHPFDVERPGGRVRLRVSLHTDGAPPPGAFDPPFAWDDLLESDPPGERERRPPVRVIAGQEALTAGVRIENPLLVMLGEDGRIEVEDRLCVTTRALAGAIETERAVVGARLEEAKASAVARAEVAKAGAEAHAEAGNPVGAAVHGTRALAHGMWARLISGSRRLTRGVAAVPDRLAAHARRASALLSTPEGRQVVWRGLRDPTELTPEQKAVTLFVGVSSILGALMLLHFVVTLAAPDLARPWRTIFLLFGYAFSTSLGVPLPIEPAIISAALSVGAAAAIVTAVLAKVLAAWMVFFIGDELHDRMREKAETSPWVGRMLSASEAFAKRFGVAAVAVFIATPGLPDAVALYVFGSLHMRLSRFLLGVAIGGTLLYTALTLGVMRIFGWG